MRFGRFGVSASTDCKFYESHIQLVHVRIPKDEISVAIKIKPHAFSCSNQNTSHCNTVCQECAIKPRFITLLSFGNASQMSVFSSRDHHAWRNETFP
jgi:hypothetical protein